MIVSIGAPKNYDYQCPEYNYKYFQKKQEKGLKKQIMFLNLRVKLLKGKDREE